MEKQIVNVYFARIPENIAVEEVIPAERDAEISRVSNERVRAEKYCVWKLLEHALYHSFGYRMDELSFERTQNGKWICDRCEFSLSHCDGAVAVAVSRSPVGVDVERAGHRFREKFAETVLHENEKKIYSSLNTAEQGDFLMSLWTQKESLFKKTGGDSFLPRSIDTFAEKTLHGNVEIAGNKYVFSVATDTPDIIRILNIDF